MQRVAAASDGRESRAPERARASRPARRRSCACRTPGRVAAGPAARPGPHVPRLRRAQVAELMRTLLSKDIEGAELRDYLVRLLGKEAQLDAAPAKTLPRKTKAAAPIERLTERELEIV